MCVEVIVCYIIVVFLRHSVVPVHPLGDPMRGVKLIRCGVQFSHKNASGGKRLLKPIIKMFNLVDWTPDTARQHGGDDVNRQLGY